MTHKFTLLSFLLLSSWTISHAQQSVARIWNEAQLNAIRIDAARPPVQARNLFHVSMAMYDAWAAYDATASTYLLGKTINGTTYPFTGIPAPTNLSTARNKSVSYAAYRVLRNRYSLSPNWLTTRAKLDSTMFSLGYDTTFTSTVYSGGDAGALGNYIAAQVIAMGNSDGANQLNNYAGTGYSPNNSPLLFYYAGNTSMTDVTRWQPLSFVTCIDQNGIPCGTNTPSFICPLWGKVFPFTMPAISASHQTRSNVDYPMYYDPGTPPKLNLNTVTDSMSQYCKWGHEMTAIWSGHLDPNDPTVWDISPHGKGNINTYPNTLNGLMSFYNLTAGGPLGPGYTVNPVTGASYPQQFVKRGDYTRIVSQYWADGPNSETPPGHWFTIVNTISDYPGFVKKIGGVGPVVPNLEWDIKAYFSLGAAMHDAAIACWGIKGWYDSPRPISMIRKMASLGQCTNSSLPNYNPGGIDLIPGYIELITMADPASLRGSGNINLNKIKLKAWKGFSGIATNNGVPLNAAGVDWILAENWMPFQRETFVTPPFAGYVSGHSTYSRAAALLLTNITGSPYFPGGLYEYTIPANSSFIGFEKSPTTTVKLQYASYKDASDEASLSRIWGGIHPPFDDMPGRLIGEQIGNEAFAKAKALFDNNLMTAQLSANSNPICTGTTLFLTVTGNNIPSNATYTWRKNGVIMANITGTQFTTNTFANADYYSCEISANGYKVGSNVITIVLQFCNVSTVNAKIYIQGYYDNGGLMKSVLKNQGESSNYLLVDYITVELHEAFPPYASVETQVAELQINGELMAHFSHTSGNYYLVVKHRNALETWSSAPIAMAPIVNYDFTLTSGKAYGDNMIEIDPGSWALYSGDIDQDGAIDAFDYVLLDPDIISGNSGNLTTDLSGDGSVDAFDYLLIDYNITYGVGSIKP